MGNEVSTTSKTINAVGYDVKRLTTETMPELERLLGEQQYSMVSLVADRVDHEFEDRIAWLEEAARQTETVMSARDLFFWMISLIFSSKVFLVMKR